MAILSSAIFKIASLEMSSHGPDTECWTEIGGALFFLASGGLGKALYFSIADTDFAWSYYYLPPNLTFLSGIIFFCAMLYFDVWNVGFYEYY